MTYAFLVSLLGAAVLGILLVYYRGRCAKYRDGNLALRKELVRASTDALNNSTAWDKERKALLATLAAKDALHRSHFNEFSALVEKCSDRAAPVLLPWVKRVLQGEGAPSGVHTEPDRLPAERASTSNTSRPDRGK